jgi:hypothetical protein
MGQREEEQLQKQSKKRIIQHRLSRKNSLTLLEMQGLAETTGKAYGRKPPLLSSFGKKSRPNDSHEDEQRHFDAVDSEMQSIDSDRESETEILAINRLGKGELTAINVSSNIVSQRKSLDFHNLLQRINHTSAGGRGRGGRGLGGQWQGE